MANMFSGKISKRIPKTLEECVQSDATVTNLHIWAERLESWGAVLCAVLIIIGVISTIIATVNMADVNEDLIFSTCLTSIITWGLYAFIEYCVYHVLALLISALASITQNTIISANVALLNADQNPETPRAPEQAPSAEPQRTSLYASAEQQSPRWFCTHCGASNKGSNTFCEMCGKEKN